MMLPSCENQLLSYPDCPFFFAAQALILYPLSPHNGPTLVVLARGVRLLPTIVGNSDGLGLSDTAQEYLRLCHCGRLVH